MEQVMQLANKSKFTFKIIYV